MRLLKCTDLITLVLAIFVSCPAKSQKILGELRKRHKIALQFKGLETSETAGVNPFLEYPLNVLFTHKASGKQYLVPGYFAADGNAWHTGADSGNVWLVHFAPDQIREWAYKVDFKTGKWVSIRTSQKLPSAGFMDGKDGVNSIGKTDKSGRDLRARGLLQYVGERYLKFAETGAYYQKCGADAPENLLAYEGFDGTLHKDGHKDEWVKTWAPHRQDWREGDPNWQGLNGKEIIGAINYLASKGMNAFTFLTMNIGGDDQIVFPYTNYNT